ncbi:heavy-metal-associated domain-containing protein [Flagellimonas beolgyonensis]|uniref:heavy-metal-associated domain-containing protein n=1 Tax=Flagellimonas beolgyonensis TaxID=864064 RepID=UPI003D65BEC7
MSLLSENVVPDNRGKIFTTNAQNEDDLMAIKSTLIKLRGIDEILIDTKKFPRELVIRTSKMVSVKEIQNQVEPLGFDIIPKGIFAI